MVSYIGNQLTISGWKVWVQWGRTRDQEGLVGVCMETLGPFIGIRNLWEDAGCLERWCVWSVSLTAPAFVLVVSSVAVYLVTCYSSVESHLNWCLFWEVFHHKLEHSSGIALIAHDCYFWLFKNLSLLLGYSTLLEQMDCLFHFWVPSTKHNIWHLLNAHYTYFHSFLASLQGKHFIGLTSTVEPGHFFKEIFSFASLKFIKFLLIFSNFWKEVICQLLGWSMDILWKDDIPAKIMSFVIVFVSACVPWEYAFQILACFPLRNVLVGQA